MRICFVIDELFAFNEYGGYGKLMRTLAEDLIKKGHTVFAVTKRHPEQRRLQFLPDGLVLLSYEQGNSIVSKVLSKRKSKVLYNLIDADVFVHIELSESSKIAMKSNPKAKNVIWFQDPRSTKDWERTIFTVKEVVEDLRGTYKFLTVQTFLMVRKLLMTFVYNPVVRNADCLIAQAEYLNQHARTVYKIPSDKKILFYPNPVDTIPEKVVKADKPTVCFLARLDGQKRSYLFFELAKLFPEVEFIAMGESHNKKRQEDLVKKYGGIPNLRMVGWKFGKEKEEILEKSWVLINTSIHEALPVSFLEAWSFNTAVLSCRNPDELVSKYGYYTGEIIGEGIKDLDKFEKGLKWLLENNRWKELGEKGYEYVKKTHNRERIVQQHINLYEELLK
jgi:glycosyltransferase involved in cell wall biosynthesis